MRISWIDLSIHRPLRRPPP